MMQNPFFNEIKTELGIYQKRMDGILVFTINPEVKSITVDDLKKQLKIFLFLQKGIPSPFMMIAPEIQNISADEKKFIHQTVKQFATVVAVVSHSPITNFFFNIFVHIYQPPVPAKLFTSEEKALEWLKKN